MIKSDRKSHLRPSSETRLTNQCNLRLESELRIFWKSLYNDDVIYIVLINVFNEGKVDGKWHPILAMFGEFWPCQRSPTGGRWSYLDLCGPNSGSGTLFVAQIDHLITLTFNKTFGSSHRPRPTAALFIRGKFYQVAQETTSDSRTRLQ